MKLWKALGLAGLAGVATTGAIIARNQRARAQLTPDQVRERLHERLEQTQDRRARPGAGPDVGPTDDDRAGQASTDSSARA